jgi:hypothetical protein
MICYGIIMRDESTMFDPLEIIPLKKIQLIMTLLNVDEPFMQAWERDCIQTHGKEDGKTIFLSELDEVMKVADFLFEEQEDGGKSIKLELTRCPWSYIQFGRRKNRKPLRWYAPNDGLENMTIYELGTTFTLFENYLQEEDEEERKKLTYKLIATLYRPPKPKTKENIRSGYEGDIRLPLLKHETMVNKRMKKMKDLPVLTAQLIIFWFASCRQQIINQYSNVFKQDDNKKESDVYGWGSSTTEPRRWHSPFGCCSRQTIPGCTHIHQLLGGSA